LETATAHLADCCLPTRKPNAILSYYSPISECPNQRAELAGSNGQPNCQPDANAPTKRDVYTNLDTDNHTDAHQDTDADNYADHTTNSFPYPNRPDERSQQYATPYLDASTT
jgi:hypothetical protein